MSVALVAFACWEDRVAPVFDTACRIRIIKVEAGRITGEEQRVLSEFSPMQKPAQLVRLGVNTLVCGAISRRLEELTEACGIQVVGFVSGDLQAVIDAWRNGRLDDDAFAMPGCCGRRRRRRFRGGWSEGDNRGHHGHGSGRTGRSPGRHGLRD